MSDPISDLKHELLAAAVRQQSHAATGREWTRAHSRRRWVIVAVAGLVLVGGTLIGNGAGTIYGATVTGLNVKLGIAVPDYDVGNGTKTWQYDSCSLARALGHIGSLQRVRNGWTDTWPSY